MKTKQVWRPGYREKYYCWVGWVITGEREVDGLKLDRWTWINDVNCIANAAIGNVYPDPKTAEADRQRIKDLLAKEGAWRVK